MKARIWEEIKDWLWRHRRPVVAVCCILSVLGITAAVILTVQGRGAMAAESIQEGIAGEIIRFHVIANSDSQEDQDLKLMVKDEIVKYMEPILRDAGDISETRIRIKDHLGEIEEKAAEVIKGQGYDYQAEAGLTKCYFPIKTYGDCTFPAGEYEALRVCIGEAQGKNWWCVLYPNLCFIDSIHAVVPEEQKEELKNVLTEEEYDSLFDWRTSDFEIKTKWF